LLLARHAAAKSQALSLGLHVALVALLFLLASLSLHHSMLAVPTDRLTPLTGWFCRADRNHTGEEATAPPFQPAAALLHPPRSGTFIPPTTQADPQTADADDRGV
jgi:hypothetical protein